MWVALAYSKYWSAFTSLVFLFALLNIARAEPVQYEVPLLENSKNIHLIWIGSRFVDSLTSMYTNDRKYDYVTTLCDHVVKSNPSAENRPKIMLWSDKNLINGSNVANPKNFGRNCRDLIEFKDVSTLFDPKDPLQASDESLTPSLGDQLGKLNSQQDGSSCASSDPKEKPSEEAVLSLRAKHAYENLMQLQGKNDLGNFAYSPMVDILKVLAVYRYGGLYFDINRNFNDLGFRSPHPLTKEHFKLCDYLMLDVPRLFTETAQYDRSEYMKSKRFFVGQLDALDYSQTIDKKRTLHRKGASTFYNMDYFFSSCPKSRLLRNVLVGVTQGYKTVQEQPFLNLFFNSRLFSTGTWVYSIGGPSAFTQFLTPYKNRLIPVSESTISYNQNSWNKNPPSGDAIVVVKSCLQKFFEKHQEHEFEHRIQGCWEQSKVFFEEKKEKDPEYIRYADDLEACIFNEAKFLLDSKTATKKSKIYLHILGVSFGEIFHNYQREKEALCGKDAQLSSTLEEMSCGKKKSVSLEALNFNNICRHGDEKSRNSPRYSRQDYGKVDTGLRFPSLTEFHKAAIHGSLKEIKKFIRARVNLNEVNSLGMTPLAYAVAEGQTEVVQLLLEAGANPFVVTRDRQSLIDFAKSIPNQTTQNKIIRLIKEAQELANLNPRRVKPLPVDDEKPSSKVKGE
jgi:hypothetical protein